MQKVKNAKSEKRQKYKKAQLQKYKNTKKAKHTITKKYKKAKCTITKSILFRRGHGEPGFPVWVPRLGSPSVN